MFPHSEQLYANLNLHFGSHCVIFNSIGFSSYSITRQCAKEGSEKSQKVFVCSFGTLNKISCKGHFGFLLPLDWLHTHTAIAIDYSHVRLQTLSIISRIQ